MVSFDSAVLPPEVAVSVTLPAFFAVTRNQTSLGSASGFVFTAALMSTALGSDAASLRSDAAPATDTASW